MSKETKRNVGIELFRIVMMLGIVMTHMCEQSVFSNVYLHRLAKTSVVGFAMISGYFGIRFAPSKVIRLYALAIGYCFLVPFLGGVFPWGGGGYLAAVRATWFAPPGGGDGTGFLWYLHAYVVVMCLSPLMEEKKFKNAFPFLAIALGWSFLASCNVLPSILPRPAGFSCYSFLTLLGIYVATRLARQNGWFERLSFRWLVPFGIIFAALVCLLPGVGLYNSPIAFAWMFLLFSLFLKIQTLGKFEKFVCFIASSMFGIYLLHGTLRMPGDISAGYGLIKAIGNYLDQAGIPLGVNYVLTIVGVFGISLVVEIARRILLKPLMPRLNAGLKRLDVVYQGFVERVCK